MKPGIKLLMLSLCLAWQAGAVDGIAVSSSTLDNSFVYWGGAPLFRYDIRNDDVVRRTVLGAGPDCYRWATINRQGTQVAFFRMKAPKGQKARVWVSHVDINGGEIKDLVEITRQDGFIPSGFLDWPVGDWIYYNLHADGEGSQKLRRVNVSTKADEPVITFAWTIWAWELSSDAKRISINVNDKSAPLNRHHIVQDFPSPIPSTSNIKYYGCNNGIAPSGLYTFGTTDAGHYNIGFWDPATGTSLKTVMANDYNAWAINTGAIQMNCSGTPKTTVGAGFQDNRWSSNSDKWVLIGLGWQNNGRFAECGSNQVLTNWVDKKTIMVSFNPRSNGNDNRFADYCDKGGATEKYLQEAGDFWVKSPIEDVNEALRPYVLSSPTQVYSGPVEDGWKYALWPSMNPTRISPMKAPGNLNLSRDDFASLSRRHGCLFLTLRSEAPHISEILNLQGRRLQTKVLNFH